MIISKKVLRNVTLTAHPLGCRQYVQNQIDWVREHARKTNDALYRPVTSDALPKRVLILGGSTGYGLSTRIVTAFAGGADTINVSFEREPSETKTATPGWYNTMAFEKKAKEAGLAAESVFGDAFSDETKARTATLIRKTLQKVDLVEIGRASCRERV